MQDKRQSFIKIALLNFSRYVKLKKKTLFTHYGFGLYNLGTLSNDHAGWLGAKMIPYLRTVNLQIHTLSHGTYLYIPNMGVPSPRAKPLAF